MIKNLLLGLLCSITAGAFAQQISISQFGRITDKKNFSDAVYYKDHFYTVENHTGPKFALSVSMEKIKMTGKIYKYDKNMFLVKETTLAEGKEVYGPLPSLLYEINGKLFLFYYYYERKSGLELYASELNITTLETLAPKKIFTSSMKKAGLSV